MKDTLNAHDVYETVRYVNVKECIGGNEFDALKSKGVPTLYSKNTGKTFIGHTDIETLTQHLS
jgi:hypothetical protein